MVFLKTSIILLFQIATALSIYDEKSMIHNLTVLPDRPFSFGGKTYSIGMNFKLNFSEAMEYCRKEGMELLSITSQYESDILGILIDDRGFSALGFYWTSGTYLTDGDSKRWVWASTGQNITYTNWSAGEPNELNNTEDCIEVRNWEEEGFTWNDLDCSEDRYFICDQFDTTDN